MSKFAKTWWGQRFVAVETPEAVGSDSAAGSVLG